MKLVAVDIGGTHARFALAEVAGGRVIALGAPVTLRTADHSGLHAAWQSFGQRTGTPLPRAAAIAVAAPVGGDVVRFTNNPWIIRPAFVPDQLGCDHVLLVNDFGAVGHAVAQVGEEHLAHVCGPDGPLPHAGSITVCGPGTGLGVAQVLRTGGAYHVIETEGGHLDFAPRDAFEDALLARLRTVHGRVSCERVVSGPGIGDIYRTLAATDDAVAMDLDDTAIWTRALAGDDPLAIAALERFCRALGAVAGDLALAHGPTGVVVAGGLGLRLHDHLPHSGFARRFVAKGRFEELMRSVPVKLITHPQPGLFGAAAAFAQEHAP